MLCPFAGPKSQAFIPKAFTVHTYRNETKDQTLKDLSWKAQHLHIFKKLGVTISKEAANAELQDRETERSREPTF